MGARKKIASTGDKDDGERPGDVSGMSDMPEMPEAPAMTGMARIGFAPIVRVDASRREIELCATSETVDSHGTIFDYNASKDAFTRWIGNVREMHGRQAVGSRVAVRCDDETRRIFVRIRISRGAQDTWEKVLDGTLRGVSIGASGVVWQRQRRRVAGEQRSLNVATRYDLVELSLVDNPSNPDALGVTFVRDAAPDVALLDLLDEPATGEDEPGEPQAPAVADASTPEQANRARLHSAAQAVLRGCGCSVCVAARALLADVRLPIERGAAAQADDPPLARALAAGLADNAIQIVALDAGVRALASAIEASLHQMAGEVGGLNRRVSALESQPLAGGPAARPVDKSSALTARGQMGAPTVRDKYHALESLGGEVLDPQVQVAIAAELIRLQQRGE
jgi:phage head maturation protease